HRGTENRPVLHGQPGRFGRQPEQDGGEGHPGPGHVAGHPGHRRRHRDADPEGSTAAHGLPVRTGVPVRTRPARRGLAQGTGLPSSHARPHRAATLTRRRKKRPVRTRLHRILRALAWTVLGWVAVTWLVVLILRFVPPATSAFMLERQVSAWVHGEKHYRRHYRWVPWAEMSKWAPLAMVAGEDQRFPLHHGFDLDAIQTAIESAEQGRRLRGASTISQQTAKNLFLWGGRS